jgi:hypothetical protein
VQQLGLVEFPRGLVHCSYLHTSAYVSIRQHTPAYGSIRQHTSAYVSTRQHIRAFLFTAEERDREREP